MLPTHQRTHFWSLFVYLGRRKINILLKKGNCLQTVDFDAAKVVFDGCRNDAWFRPGLRTALLSPFVSSTLRRALSIRLSRESLRRRNGKRQALACAVGVLQVGKPRCACGELNRNYKSCESRENGVQWMTCGWLMLGRWMDELIFKMFASDWKSLHHRFMMRWHCLRTCGCAAGDLGVTESEWVECEMFAQKFKLFETWTDIWCSLCWFRFDDNCYAYWDQKFRLNWYYD